MAAQTTTVSMVGSRKDSGPLSHPQRRTRLSRRWRELCPRAAHTASVQVGAQFNACRACLIRCLGSMHVPAVAFPATLWKPALWQQIERDVPSTAWRRAMICNAQEI